jgi:hypothetical protein
MARLRKGWIKVSLTGLYQTRSWSRTKRLVPSSFKNNGSWPGSGEVGLARLRQLDMREDPGLRCSPGWVSRAVILSEELGVREREPNFSQLKGSVIMKRASTMPDDEMGMDAAKLSDSVDT